MEELVTRIQLDAILDAIWVVIIATVIVVGGVGVVIAHSLDKILNTLQSVDDTLKAISRKLR